MVRLRRVLVVLCVFLTPAVTPYAIGKGCENLDIHSLVDDAMFLTDRAVRFLDELALGHASPVCQGAVYNIISALVGVNAAGNQQTYNIIRERLRQVRDGVGRFGTGRANIIIHCEDPQMKIDYTTGEPPTTNQINVHPVALRRISGVQLPTAPAHLFSQSDVDGLWYYFVWIGAEDDVEGFTVSSHPGSKVMAEQEQDTGSRVAWSDIVLKSAILPAPVGLGSVEGWTPAKLRQRQLGLIDFDDFSFMTIIHEATHSTALTNPIQGHAQVDGHHANSILDILHLARHNNLATLDNPETYSFLAFALSMPWLKWWDSDTNNHPLATHNLLTPMYNYQPKAGSTSPTVCLPRYLPVPQGQTEIFRQLERGPAAFTNWRFG